MSILQALMTAGPTGIAPALPSPVPDNDGGLPPHVYVALGAYHAAVTVPDGTVVVASPLDGTLYRAPAEEATPTPRPGRLSEVGALFSGGAVAAPREPSPLSLPHGLLLPPGITTLLAPAEWGKTTLLRNVVIPSLIDQGHSVAALHYIEPVEDALGDLPALSIVTPSHLLRVVAGWLADPEGEQVLIIDSLRAFVYGRSTGGTGVGGVDRLFAPQLTALSNLVAAAGRHLLAVVNPLADSMEIYTPYVVNMRSSVPGVWAAADGVRPPGPLDARELRCYARGRGIDRAAATRTVTLPAEGAREAGLETDPRGEPAEASINHITATPARGRLTSADPALRLGPNGLTLR